MSTRATPAVIKLAGDWERLYASAVLSGIVGNEVHFGGYHISIQDNPAGNYSIVRADDKAPPGSWPRDCAAAIDMNLDLGDMKRCHARLIAVWRNRASDPRARYINAHNGWDGNDNAGRYDWVNGSVDYATDDHKWHVHLEIRRRYVNDVKAMAAVLSILRGESLDDYLGDDMALGTDKITLTKDAAKELGGNYKEGTQVTGEQALNLLFIYACRADDKAAAAGLDAKAAVAGVQGLDARLGRIEDWMNRLGADGSTPEQTAAALRTVLGDDAAEVGRLLAGA